MFYNVFYFSLMFLHSWTSMSCRWRNSIIVLTKSTYQRQPRCSCSGYVVVPLIGVKTFSSIIYSCHTTHWLWVKCWNAEAKMRNGSDWSTWPQLLRSLPHAKRGRHRGKLRNADAESIIMPMVLSTTTCRPRRRANHVDVSVPSTSS